MPTKTSGFADVARRVGEALGEPVAALRDDLEAGRQPGAGRAVEDEHAPPRGRPGDGVERVGERGLGELRRLLGRERRAQAGLDAPGQRLLGHDDERGGHGRDGSRASHRPAPPSPDHPSTATRAASRAIPSRTASRAPCVQRRGATSRLAAWHPACVTRARARAPAAAALDDRSVRRHRHRDADRRRDADLRRPRGGAPAPRPPPRACGSPASARSTRPSTSPRPAASGGASSSSSRAARSASCAPASCARRRSSTSPRA